MIRLNKLVLARVVDSLKIVETSLNKLMDLNDCQKIQNKLVGAINIQSKKI